MKEIEPTREGLRFVPSRVDGLDAVTAVVVYSDRLELTSANKQFVIRFLDIARWYRWSWFWRLLAKLGWLGGQPFVADRDWFHPPSERFFQFYTSPPITIFMPDEPRDLAYGATIFRRVEDVIAAGGFATFDLG